MDLLGAYSSSSDEDESGGVAANSPTDVPTSAPTPLVEKSRVIATKKKKRQLQLSKVLPPDVYTKLIERKDEEDSDSDDNSPRAKKNNDGLSVKSRNINGSARAVPGRSELNGLLSSLKSGPHKAATKSGATSQMFAAVATKKSPNSVSSSSIGLGLTTVITTTSRKKKTESNHNDDNDESDDSDSDGGAGNGSSSTLDFIRQAAKEHQHQRQNLHQQQPLLPSQQLPPQKHIPSQQQLPPQQQHLDEKEDEEIEEQKRRWAESQQRVKAQQQQQQQQQQQPHANNKRKRRDMELALMSGDTSALSSGTTHNTSLSAPNPEFDYQSYSKIAAPPPSNESTTSVATYDPKTGEVIKTRNVTSLNARKGQISKLAANAARMEAMLANGSTGGGNKTKAQTNAKYGW